MGCDAPAPDLCLPAACADRLFTPGAGYSLLPPRALGWLGLPTRAGRRADPTRGEDLRYRRCLGCIEPRSSVSVGLAGGARARTYPIAGWIAFRAADRRSVLEFRGC